MSTLIQNAQNYAPAFQASDITTSKMRAAITEWVDLYFHNTDAKDEDTSQQIPKIIVRKLTKAIFAEYSTASQNKFAAMILKALESKHSEAMQMALIAGESLLKPIPTKEGFRFMVVPRHNVLVFGRDAEGNMIDVGMIEKTAKGNCYYTLLERRTVDGNGILTIRYRLYKAYNKENLGTEVPLASIEQYSQLQLEYTFPRPVGSVGLASLKTPMVNCVDGSADSVSVYASAVGLIHNINRNEALLKGEFERGQSRVMVSADMLKKDRSGNATLDQNLFVGLDEDPENTGITIFSPTLRESSFLALKQEYLRNVETVIGLKRGLLSEVEAAERTATEITSSAGEYNLTVIELQQVWEKTVREVLRICAVLGDLYKIPNACEIKPEDVAVSWGNGVLYDEEKTWADYKDMVAKGLLKPEIAVGWRFDRPTETPDDLRVIREQLMPSLMEEVE